MKKFSLILGLFILHLACLAQDEIDNKYVPPDESEVRKNITEWQNLKFGLFMHWGPYSQWGVVESWTLNPQDLGWNERKGPAGKNYFEYKKAYENLNSTFNPVQFNPEKWAKAAKEAGMRYMVFTTKHHDGFSMFDTKQTDYKITDSKTLFSSNPRSNVTKEIFNVFRKQDFMVGAYFSKPDWHTEYYWWPYFPPKDGGANYDPEKYPERWQKFKDFTYNQIEELVSDYGKVDILWLDGGQVRPRVKGEDGYNEDINMANIASMARKHQPGLIMVDRSVPGKFENYKTPEQTIPDHPLSYPWETCMTMGNSWAFVPHDQYKSVHQLVALLVKVVSRGGNFLLNIGVGPNGDWDPVAYERLQGIGEWMKINGEGIYNSEFVKPYSADNLYYTKLKNKPVQFVFMLSDTNQVHFPAVINIPLNDIKNVRKVTLMGVRQTLKWKFVNNKLEIKIPLALRENNGLKNAAAFKIEY
ncbi:MAG TPA: alpha-L-fucosidase [Flavitalea sp.]|nr:alpha-L-fucosidase [Flavitalea sp.]